MTWHGVGADMDGAQDGAPEKSGMKIAFDTYRLQLAHGPNSTAARQIEQRATSILTLQGSGKDETWLAVRGPEARSQTSPPWAIRVRYHRQPGVFLSLAVVSHTHRLFLAADRDHWVIDLQGQISLVHRKGSPFQNFQVFADGVLAADEEHLYFYGPFGKPRWHTTIAPPWHYECEAGVLKIVTAQRTETFPLVVGPPDAT